MKKQKHIRIIFFIIGLAALAAGLYNYFAKVLPVWATYVFGGIAIASANVFLITFIISHLLREVETLNNRLALWNNITYRVKNAGEYAFTRLPIGIIVFDNNNTVEWANAQAREFFHSELVERDLEELDETVAKALDGDEERFVTEIYGKDLEFSVLKEERIIYLKDVSALTALKAQYDERTLALGIINLDNLDVALSNVDAKERSIQLSNLIGIISEWIENYDVVIKGYSEERFLLLTDSKNLTRLIQKKFPVLDKISEYCFNKGLRISASIGFACEDLEFKALMELANEQIELAINRGGNQVVVRRHGKIEYFGAKAESFSSRTPVNIRHRAEELADLIKGSTAVYVMGHKASDTDSFGAAIGMRKLAEALGVPAYVIFESKLVDATVNRIYETIKASHNNFLQHLKTPDEVRARMKDTDLLIIVDIQYMQALMDERVFKKAKKIAIIDHHRRSEAAINRYDFLYIESSASSTVELVTELIPFIGAEVEFSAIEATWMAAGIIVDTNNFVYRTSRRTFDAMAILQNYDADMMLVHQFLSDLWSELKLKSEILLNTENYLHKYAISVVPREIAVEPQFLAKVSDETIMLDGVALSCTIGRLVNGRIGMSFRSLGEANAQLVAEHFKGGGHFTGAAAQITGKTIDEIRTLLKEYLAILQESEQETKMKIILRTAVKGLGEAHDVVDVPMGRANYLIKASQAVKATPDNLRNNEQEVNKREIAQEKELEAAKALKKKIEALTLSITAKVGTTGKMFGAITKKEIAEALKLTHNIEIDKHNIQLDAGQNIQKLGTYSVLVQLHPEVNANLALHIVEKE